MSNDYFKKMITKKQIESILNRFTDGKKLSINNTLYYQTAFIQKSARIGGRCNEKLEFLGDSFYNAITVEYLFNRFEEADEGFLTKLKTKLVSKTFLAFFGKELGFEEHILTSKKIVKVNDRFLEDSFESFIGAIIKDDDGDISKARLFIVSLLDNLIDFSDLISNNDNFKEQLLHVFQKYKMIFPTYTLIEEDKKYFKVGVYIDGEKYNLVPEELRGSVVKTGDNEYLIGTGEGEIKRDAEQECSKNILTWFK